MNKDEFGEMIRPMSPGRSILYILFGVIFIVLSFVLAGEEYGGADTGNALLLVFGIALVILGIIRSVKYFIKKRGRDEEE
jgi:uncharacterized membrane protein HdeD (DUF308 family)